MTARAIRALRGAAQLLAAQRASGAEEVVGRLLAVQAQDLRAARLAIRARSDGLVAADVDRELAERRSLVVGWLARGTLHLVRREDYPWLLGLTAPARATSNRRRLAQEGVPEDHAERAVEIVARALADDGPLTRPQLAERIARAGIRTAGQATPHLLMLAALRGVAVLGPVADGVQAFAAAREWLGAAAPGFLDDDRREAALAELARRYLAGHGPATPADLAAWVGLPLRDARAGLAAIAGELVEHDGGLVDLAARGAAAEPPPARLLGGFDPYLLGWRDRSLAVAPEHARSVHPGGGMLRAVAIVEGVAAATWTARRGGGRLAVALEPFGALATDAAAALRAEAADVARFEALRLA